MTSPTNTSDHPRVVSADSEHSGHEDRALDPDGGVLRIRREAVLGQQTAGQRALHLGTLQVVADRREADDGLVGADEDPQASSCSVPPEVGQPRGAHGGGDVVVHPEVGPRPALHQRLPRLP